MKNFSGLTPLLLAIKRKQKGAIRDILRESKIFINKFDLNALDIESGYNAVYMLLKHKLSDLAEKLFLKGGNILINLPGGWKK